MDEACLVHPHPDDIKLKQLHFDKKETREMKKKSTQILSSRLLYLMVSTLNPIVGVVGVA
jgi:hypothetical protein